MTILEASDLVRWDHSSAPPKPKLPPDAPADLVEFVKANRDAVITAAGDRYLRVPPASWAGAPAKELNGRQKRRLTDYVQQQLDIVGAGDPLFAWWKAHSIYYGSTGHPDANVRTAVDLIAWQFAHKPDPIQFILDLQ